MQKKLFWFFFVAGVLCLAKQVLACPSGLVCPAGKVCVEASDCVSSSSGSTATSSEPTTTKDQLGLTLDPNHQLNQTDSTAATVGLTEQIKPLSVGDIYGNDLVGRYMEFYKAMMDAWERHQTIKDSPSHKSLEELSKEESALLHKALEGGGEKAKQDYRDAYDRLRVASGKGLWDPDQGMSGRDWERHFDEVLRQNDIQNAPVPPSK